MTMLKKVWILMDKLYFLSKPKAQHNMFFIGLLLLFIVGLIIVK